MDELEISGKRYISTRRAGKEHGYHSDYIGQLIRGGKVAGQKVGRAWYVDAESLAGYLGKEYAKPAAENAAMPDAPAAPAESPTPVPEERAPEQIPEVKNEEVPTIEEDVSEPEIQIKKEEEPQLVEGQPQAAEEIKTKEEKEDVNAVGPSRDEHVVAIRKPVVVAATANDGLVPKQSEPAVGGLRYMADDEPLLPEIPRAASASGHAEIAPTREDDAAHTPKKGRPVAAALAAVAVGAVVFALSAAASSLVATTTRVIDGQTASVTYSIGQ